MKSPLFKKSKNHPLSRAVRNIPMTPSDRILRLFKYVQSVGQDYPTEDQLIEAVHDAEYDTLLFPATVAERHGIPFGWKKEIKWDKGIGEEQVIEEEILDQLIEESNEE